MMGSKTVSNLLILFAILGLIATFGPSAYYEAKFKIEKIRGVKYSIPEETTTTPLGEILKKYQSQKKANSLSLIEILIPKDTEFSILILKIGLNAKVFPNINSSNPNEFLPILEKGVAHAKGTVFPGMEGSIYLFAHSTDNFWNVGRYNAFFYLLKELSVGDEIIIFFQNRRYNYIMSESRIIDPSDVSYLTKTQKGQEVLILQTCWPPGTTWKRLLIFAKRK